jgi:hypothetical protein
MATPPIHNPKAALSRIAARWPEKARSRPLIAIRDWKQHFENSQSERLVRLSFVLMPNKHDGKSYRRLARRDDFPQVFTTWVLIAQLSSKAPARGFLCDEEGPYRPLDIADMTGLDCDTITAAIDILRGEEIGWLEHLDSQAIFTDTLRTSENLRDSGQESTTCDTLENLRDSQRKTARREGKGIEGNGKEEAPYRPQGDKSQPDDVGTDAAAQKKSGPAPGSMEAITLTVAKICSYFPKRTAKVLSAAGMHGLRTIAEALPLPDSDWLALDAIFDARKKEGRASEDYTLRKGWLDNAECLAENLLAAVDTARAWRQGISAPARTRADGIPADWRERFAEKFPGAVAGSWDDLTKAQQAEVRA